MKMLFEVLTESTDKINDPILNYSLSKSAGSFVKKKKRERKKKKTLKFDNFSPFFTLAALAKKKKILG
jgi:hypothetical protein